MTRPQGPPPPLPDWATQLVEDTTHRIQNATAARKLTYRGTVVREVKRPKQAYNIVTILVAFEAAGWPPRIDDPHGRQPSDETRRRDVENLNKLIKPKLMKFACDGNGTGFLWESLSQPRAVKAKKAGKAEKATKPKKATKAAQRRRP